MMMYKQKGKYGEDASSSARGKRKVKGKGGFDDEDDNDLDNGKLMHVHNCKSS